MGSKWREEEEGTKESGRAEGEVEPMLRCLSQASSVEARSAAARYFRHLLAKPPTSACHDALPLPLLIQRLVACLPISNNNPDIQLDATWALTNILCGEQAHLVVQAGAPHHLLSLTHQAYSRELRDQAVWALANIAGDCDACRLHLHGLGFIGRLHELIHAHKSDVPPVDGIFTLKTAVWALSNMCRGTLIPSMIGALLPVLQVIVEMLGASEVNEEVAVDATWCLAYVANGDTVAAMAVVGSGAIPVLVRLLTRSDMESSVMRGAVRALGNLLTGGDAETQAVIDGGAIPALHALLYKKLDEGLRRESVWCLSNVAAGTVAQVDQLLGEEGLVETVSNLCRLEEGKVGREAAWTLSNAVTGGSRAHVRFLVANGAVKALARCMDVDLGTRLLYALVGTFRCLLENCDEDKAAVLILLRNARLPSLLVRLPRHHNRSLRLAVHHLLRSHFTTNPTPRLTPLPPTLLTVNCP